MDYKTEFNRPAGLTKTIRIKDHKYDIVEFTITQKLVDSKGTVICDNGYTQFFSEKEFKVFFEPIVNELKVRFENASNEQ